VSDSLDVGTLAITLGVLIMLGAAIFGRRPVRGHPATKMMTLEHAVPAGPAPGAPHAGAVLGWSPQLEVRTAEASRDRIEDLAAAERAELADASAELASLITAEQRAMAKAFRAFDAAMLAPMRIAQQWHQDGRAHCARCTGADGKVFGHLGEDTDHIGIRAFRTDSPTAAYPIVVTT
jgi:hypothetical protein